MHGLFSIPWYDGPSADAEGSSCSSALEYIAGPENRLLQILADVVISEIPAFTPISLIGQSGSGKSHLLRGCQARLQQSKPNFHVRYVTASDFSRAFIQSIELNAQDEFVQGFTNLDALLVDNLHELENKDSSQVQLQQIIDHLVGLQRLVLVSIRSSATNSFAILPSLRSRLDGGLTIEVSLPETQTRECIAQRLAEVMNVSMSHEELRRLISPSVGRKNSHATATWSVRSIRSAILRHHLNSMNLDHATKELADDPAGTARNERARIHHVLKTVAKISQCSVVDLTGPSRRKGLVRARSIAAYLLRNVANLTFADIGHYLGRRDHTTVLHAYRQLEESLPNDIATKKLLDEIASILT